MAENQIINKVVDHTNTYESILLDLTQDTVNRGNLEKGITAHDREGENLVGQLDVEDAEAWARGTRGGAEVDPDDPTFHNNSKWYSTVSGSIMQIAGQIAQAAATSATNAEYNEKLAQSYSKGNSGLPDRPGEETDNAEYFMTQAEASSIASGSSMRIAGQYAEESEQSAIVSGSGMRIAGEYSEDSEAWAIGVRNGVPVPSVDPTYHNNSKYYAEQAEQSSIAAGSSMLIAGQSASIAEQAAIAAGSSMLIAGNYADASEQSAIRSGSSANIAGLSAETANDNALKSEGFAVGRQNGSIVPMGNPYYHNNAEYFKDLAEAAAAQAGALDMTGATATTDGAHGLIKQPHAGDQDKPFHGDGTYKSVVADKVVLSSPLNIGGQSQTEVEGSIQALNNTKQDNLTFDNSPTQNSNNPVKSGGIYTDIAKCIDYEMTTPSLSAGSVNITLYNPAITAEMKARPYADYSTSGAYADLTVNTYDGSVTLTGTVSAATTITFWLYTPNVISNIPQ